MTQEHPITPPPELVQQWLGEHFGTTVDEISDVEQILANKAARWGADMELEACCALLLQEGAWFWPEEVARLRATRRPQPLSLKELNLKHLEVMERDCHYLPEFIADLRRAIESLPS